MKKKLMKISINLNKPVKIKPLFNSESCMLVFKSLDMGANKLQLRRQRFGQEWDQF